MAKRGCCRVYTIVLVVVLSFLFSVVPVAEDSAATDWFQNTDSDFGRGVFSNTVLAGTNDSAYVRLSRLNQWANMSSPSSPPPREGHRMVYDNTNDVFVLFGGRNSTAVLGDTWLFYDSNNTWTQVFPGSPPTPRFGHSMIYDSFNDVVILFGGNDGSDVLGDTHVYSVSGNTWTNMNPSNPPDDREKQDMAYDSDNHQVIMFGGNNNIIAFNDTWKYTVSQNDWVEMSPSDSPSPRYGHSMTYDSSQGLFVLFGGGSGADVYNDTWAYDSALDEWVQTISIERPTSRRDHSIAFSPYTGPMLFGGWENSDIGASEQWESLGCNLSSQKKFTTLTRFGDYLYIGSADLTQNAWIYRYSDITGICEPWKNTGEYFIYASFAYDGYLFFGTRNNTMFAEGNLYYTDGVDLHLVPGDVWWRPDRPGLILGGWIQDFEVYDGKLFVSGSSMVSNLPSWNNFFVKTCGLAPCNTNASWQWTNTSKDRLDLLDDGLSFETFDGNLYLGTYDYASVIRYYPSNNSWWLSLNGSIDGNRTKGGRGIYSLVSYDGCLRAYTLNEGWNWTLCQTDGNWVGGKVTEYDNFVRGLVFRDRLFISANQSGTQVIASYNGTSWANSLDVPGNEVYLYMAEFAGSLYATSGQEVYRKRVIQNDLWTYTTSNGSWLQLEPEDSLPSPRQGHSLTYCWNNDVFVLFGGRNDTSYLNDTWVFNRSVPSGVFTSSVMDTSVSGLPTFWTSVSWAPQVQIYGTEVKFQLASNNDSVTWVYRGPDGTSGSYYDNPIGEQIWSGHQGNRYLKYRAYFSTTTPLSPKVQSVTIGYFRPPFPPSLSSPEEGVWNHDGQPNFAWTFLDPDLSDTQGAYQVLIDDQQTFPSVEYDSGMIMSGAQNWQPPTSIDDGTWFWTVRTMDNNGFWGTSAPPRILKVDKAPPSSSLDGLVSGMHLNGLNLVNGTSQDSFSGTEGIEIVIKRILDQRFWNGTGWQNQEHWLPSIGTTQWSFDATSVNWVSEREYSITSRATDIAGNIETPTESVTFIFDSTSPSVTMLNPVGAESPEGGRDIDIQWTATDTYLNQSSIRISYSTDGGSNWNTIVENELNDGSYNWTLPRMKTDMRIRVEAEDLAGNVGAEMSGVFYVRAPEKHDDWLTEFWWVLLIIILLAVGAALYYWRRRTSASEEEESGPPPIVATAGETTLCAVCLGTIKEGLSVIKCGDCGKTFHEKCAARIEKCPNCESKLDMSELEEE